MIEKQTLPPTPAPAHDNLRDRIKRLFNTSSPLQKGLMIYGGILALLFVFSLVGTGIVLVVKPSLFSSSGGSGGAESKTFWSKYAGQWEIEGDNDCQWKFQASDSGISGLSGGVTRPNGTVLALDYPPNGGSGAKIDVDSDDSATVMFGTIDKGALGDMKLKFSGSQISGTFIASPGHESAVRGTVHRTERTQSASPKASTPPASGADAELQAMLALGNKYGPTDQTLANLAIKWQKQGMAWSSIDETMGHSSLEMQAAYQKWRAKVSR